MENKEFNDLFQEYIELIMEANDILIKMQEIKIKELAEVYKNELLPSS